MPLRWLKKSKQQYTVSSKALFVLSVELLDGSHLECTLNAESTGRDCMDNVCQRLNLQQADLFGLRYVSRRSYPKIRWVDLDRPLKKQLNKYAQEPYLYMGVMFYVHDVSLLEDEVTRYHYFLQLKLDVTEGRLRCNFEQAIVLASYSLQAEHGDHDPEKHTFEYLQEFPLLPKPIMQQFPEDKISTLTDAIIMQHRSRCGMAQQLAEVYYIVGTQQLDGYGQESFLAKDIHGSEVLLGASLTGIVVRKGNGISPQFFKWHEITNLVNHKRIFGIETQHFEYSTQFLLDEPDAAKYVWKMCVLQHTFYKLHAGAAQSNELSLNLDHPSHQDGLHQAEKFHQHQLQHPSQQSQQQQQPQHYFDVILDGGGGGLQHPYPTTIQHAEIQNFLLQTQRVDLSPMKFHQLRQQQQQHMLLDQQQSQSQQHLPRLEHSALDVTGNTTLQQSFNNYVLQHSVLDHSAMSENVYGNVAAPGGGGSAADLDPRQQHHFGGQNAHLRPPAPGYRPAPDYETAVRNKYGSLAVTMLHQPPQQQQQQPQQTQPQHRFQIQPLSDQLLSQQLQLQHAFSSQPSLLTESQLQLQYHHVGNGHVGGVQHALEPHPHQPAYLESSHLLQSGAFSSTPELNRVGISAQALHNSRTDASQASNFLAELQRMNMYKPPPPYPGSSVAANANAARLSSSTSTPDLAGGALHHLGLHNLGPHGAALAAAAVAVGNGGVGLGGSSPDLMSRRNGGIADGFGGSRAMHKTFENLHTMELSNRLAMTAHSTEELKGAVRPHLVHDLVPGNFVAYSRDVSSGVMSTLQQTTQPTEEPIYQNQRELKLQQQQLLEQQQQPNSEPIYQNLPVHEKIMFKQRLLEEQQRKAREMAEAEEDEQSRITETAASEECVSEPALGREQTSEAVSQAAIATAAAKAGGHVSRVAITNSRENLESEPAPSLAPLTQPPEAGGAAVRPEKPKRAITKISIGGSVAPPPPEAAAAAVVSGHEVTPNKQLEVSRPRTETAPVAMRDEPKAGTSLRDSASMSPPEPRSKTLPVVKQVMESEPALEQYHHTPRTPGSKPRAGRKRWALNFGNKTGSLKSVKSESGSHKSQDSFDGSGTVKSTGSGIGPMMKATLHGLSRSRPDLLALTPDGPSFFGPTAGAAAFTFSSPSKMPKDEIGAYLEAKLERGEVLNEFERIPKKKSGECKFQTALLAENQLRNRFRDVLPYDENRVRLTAPDKDNKAGYINASHMSATVGADQQRFYIAAQGPLPNTVLHFWQMILQCDVHVVVMLTDVVSASKTSAPAAASGSIPYWPQKNGSTLELGDFRIVKKYTSESACYTTSTFQVTHAPSKTRRNIWHLQYTDWSENGCPSNVRSYIEFLALISELRRHTATEIPAGRNRNPPVLVHCSAGVGRTGVTILCDILLYCVDHNLDVDIPKVLTHLRQQRMHMVQTMAQYKFVHTVLINYLKQSRLI